MSAQILELSKVPIIDPQSSLTLIDNWKDRLSTKAVAALAQNIARSAVGKLRHAIDHEDRHCYDSLLFGGSGRTCSKDTGSEGDTLGGWRR